MGHHVQNLLGTMRNFDQASATLDERQRNALSVRLELQADCYAGVWGFYAAKRNLLEPGDAEEGLRAASAVGDDAIQKRTQGYVVPDGFTHGKAEQRMRWFKTGLESGDPRSCNTFAAKASDRATHACASLPRPGCAASALRGRAVGLETHATHDAVVLGLDRQRDLLALCRVHATAAGAARVALVLARPHLGMSRHSCFHARLESIDVRPPPTSHA